MNKTGLSPPFLETKQIKMIVPVPNAITSCAVFCITHSLVTTAFPPTTSIRQSVVYCQHCNQFHPPFYSCIAPPSAPLKSAALIYKTLLHLINTSPNEPANWPSINSSVFSNCKFMYASDEANLP